MLLGKNKDYSLKTPNRTDPERVSGWSGVQFSSVAPYIIMPHKGRGTVFEKLIKKDPCSYCGGSGGTRDHIWPRFKGNKFPKTNEFGIESWQNMTGSCIQCNCKKGFQLLIHFLVNNPIPV